MRTATHEAGSPSVFGANPIQLKRKSENLLNWAVLKAASDSARPEPAGSGAIGNDSRGETGTAPRFLALRIDSSSPLMPWRFYCAIHGNRSEEPEPVPCADRRQPLLATAGEFTDEAVHVWSSDLTPDVAAQAVDLLS